MNWPARQLLYAAIEMLKVMVVDENPLVARAIARILAEYDVTIEVDPSTAVARVVDAEVDGQPYDLVVCDTSTPRATGLDVLSATRALERPPMFVLISGHPEVGDSGADAVLVKPFTAQELRALVTCLVAARATAPTRRLRRVDA